MKEQDIVQLALGEIQAALPDTLTARTEGGDASSSPPLAILSWDSSRIQLNGANPFAGTVTDSNGDDVGEELHRYHTMTLDIMVRAYDESQRDVWLSDVADHFLPFEYRAGDFHTDTFEWEIGNAEPRNNPVVEPDWYESGVTIRFNYVSRVTQTQDTLTAVDKTVSGDY